MKKNVLILLSFVLLLGACAEKRSEQRILVLSKTEGFRHKSIEVGKVAKFPDGPTNAIKAGKQIVGANGLS